MKKVLFIILLLVSGLAYAQNPIYGKKVVGLDSLVSDTLKGRTRPYSYATEFRSGNVVVDNLTLNDSSIENTSGGINFKTNSTNRAYLDVDGVWDFNDNDLVDIDDINVEAIYLSPTGTTDSARIFTTSSADLELESPDDIILWDAISSSYTTSGRSIIARADVGSRVNVVLGRSSESLNIDYNSSNLTATIEARSSTSGDEVLLEIKSDTTITFSSDSVIFESDIVVDQDANITGALNVDEINDNAGTGAPDFPNGFTVGGSTEILSYFNGTSVSGNGDLTGTIYLQRVDNFVTVWWTSMTHTSATSAASNSGLIPTAYRPTAETNNVYRATGSVVRNVTVATDGTITFNYFDWAGAGFSRGATDVGSITYRITP